MKRRWLIPSGPSQLRAWPALVVLGYHASEQRVQARNGLGKACPLLWASSPPLQAHLQERIVDRDAPGLSIESKRPRDTEEDNGQLAHLPQPGRNRSLRNTSVAHADRGRRVEALAHPLQGVGEPSEVMRAIPGRFAHRHPRWEPMPLGVARQPDVLKDRPRGRGAEDRIMPEAQELTQVLHRGTRLQPTEVLKRL